MGKKHRQRDGQNTRTRLEQLLAKGDTRGAVDAAKQLVRDQPGAASEELAVRAYAARIRELIAEGLGREAGALASVVRERFPAHIASVAALLEEARLAAGDFSALLTELREAPEERRAAIEDRLLPWIVDPAAIGAAEDPLGREGRIVAELFEVVTSRLATPEELAPLGEIRRRSPLAPWKLLIRAIDAFHRNEDERVATNAGAVDPRSPAKRAADVLVELTTGKQKPGRNFAAERLIDRVSGGRATLAARIRAIETASHGDDRRRLREEVRELAKTFDTLSPYEREQVRIALLPLCGIHFGPEQVAAMLRVDESAMPRYATLLVETAGSPFAGGAWVAYADGLVDARPIEPWQAAEIYLHALSLGDGEDDGFVCRDPTHGHPVDEMPVDTKQVLEKIIATRPGPAVLARIAPHLDRLPSKEEPRILKAWRKADPENPEPLVRLLRIAEEDRRYDDVPALLREGDKLRTIDPEYGRLRFRLSFRAAEKLLVARKRGAAAAILDEIAARPEDLGDDVSTYLLALQWAAAPPAQAGELLAELARRGLVAEVVLAEVTGALDMQVPLPASEASPAELLDGLQRAVAILRTVGRPLNNIGWIVEKAAVHMDVASEAQIFALGDAAVSHGMHELAWRRGGRRARDSRTAAAPVPPAPGRDADGRFFGRRTWAGRHRRGACHCAPRERSRDRLPRRQSRRTLWPVRTRGAGRRRDRLDRRLRTEQFDAPAAGTGPPEKRAQTQIQSQTETDTESRSLRAMNPYRELGIADDTGDDTDNDDAIRNAWLDAVRRFPPEKEPEKFARIREAYELVRDREARFRLRMFGDPRLRNLDALIDFFPAERKHAGPALWLAVIRGGAR